jgi:hypothetical protein
MSGNTDGRTVHERPLRCRCRRTDAMGGRRREPFATRSISLSWPSLLSFTADSLAYLAEQAGRPLTSPHYTCNPRLWG